MTERLYYSHPMLTSCDAAVVSCEKAGEGFAVVLDRTIIFPEGGGQPADHGFIGDARIIDAQEKDGLVYHICDREVPAGAGVTVTLDIPRRLDHTQQHTGEHILSGLAFKLFGAHNVGFHMAEDYCTIDLDAFLDREKLSRLEREANAAVRAALPVTEEHMDHEALDRISIRKKADIKSDDIRVVFIDGGNIDSCTCCGTHCANTGEVGYIRIGDSQKYKSGVRLWFSCGGRAVNEAIALTDSITELARSYSTSREELPMAVRKQSDELAALKRELKARTRALCGSIAEGCAERNAVIVREGFGADDVKMLTECVVGAGAELCLAFGEKDGRLYYRALRSDSSKAPMNELIKAVNGLVCGKGGGSPAFAQGSAEGRLAPETLETLKSFVQKWAAGQ